MQLKIGVRTLHDGIVVADCSGRIVFGEETAELRDRIRALISKGSRIVLNLADVTYIDSGGLGTLVSLFITARNSGGAVKLARLTQGTLVSLFITARNSGGAVKLARLTQRVGDLLQITKLLTVFEVYDSEEEAVQSFRQGAAA